MADIRHLENRVIVHVSSKNHPILMKFGTQQQIWNSITVTLQNMKFLYTIQDGGRPPY